MRGTYLFSVIARVDGGTDFQPVYWEMAGKMKLSHNSGEGQIRCTTGVVNGFDHPHPNLLPEGEGES